MRGYPAISKETNTDARTFTLGDLSPKFYKQSQKIRPLSVSRNSFLNKPGQCRMISSQILPAVDGQHENDKDVILYRIYQAISLFS